MKQFIQLKKVGFMSGLLQKIAFCLLCLCSFLKLNAQDFSAISAEMKDIYHQLHQYPEIGHEEFRTSELIRKTLERIGYTSDSGTCSAMILETGELGKKLPTLVIAVLDTQRPGPVICFRADIDALKLQENTQLPFASQCPGRMHACGHDAHTSILLATAKVLKEKQDELCGKVVFLFQPAEEVAGGADDIVNDGILDRLRVNAVFALHVAHAIPVGTVQLLSGPILSGSNSFTIRLIGRSSHPAFPEQGNDIILAGAEIALELAKLPARQISIVQCPTIISITSFQAGTGTSIMPGEAVLRGTIRSFFSIDDPSYNIQGLVEKHIQARAAPFGLTWEIQWKKGTPPTINHPHLYQKLVPRIQQACSLLQIQPGKKSMASEDFAYYAQKYPCLYFSLGIAKDGLGEQPLHSSQFVIHERALDMGLQLWITITEIILNTQNPFGQLD